MQIPTSFRVLEKHEKSLTIIQSTLIIALSCYLIFLWITLKRPIFLTLAETRLWYSYFLLTIGFVTYLRWKISLLLLLTNVLAFVFLIINFLKPELQTQTLMPALQSFWFIPHVAIYMFAYAVLACALLLAIIGLLKKQEIELVQKKCDLLVNLGICALTFGLCFGAIWAKKAWGVYWSWDIKETFALITLLSYLSYNQYKKLKNSTLKGRLIILIISFFLLQFTWYGVNFLPKSIQNKHSYIQKQ